MRQSLNGVNLALYLAIGRLSFRRSLAYRTANLAGLFTNAAFGYLYASVFVALYGMGGGGSSTQIGGYDVGMARSFIWADQALIMVVALWGWWDVEQTVRTGDVVTDLARPFSFLFYWLARDMGRALYFLLFRAAPIYLVGVVVSGGLNGPVGPMGWLALAASLVLANTVAFCFRFLVNLTAFWTIDARGFGALVQGLVTFLGGFIVPLRFFPDWLQPLLLALPFASIVQTPADIMAGRLSGSATAQAVAVQLLWAAVMLLLARCGVALALRRVVVQGG